MNAVLQLGYNVCVTIHSLWQKEVEEILKESEVSEVEIQGNDLIGTLRGINTVRTN